MPNLHEQRQREPSAAQVRRTAAAIFALYSGSNDERRFNAAYVGRWEDRAAFGEKLLSDYGADKYLQGVPSWLK